MLLPDYDFNQRRFEGNEESNGQKQAQQRDKILNLQNSLNNVKRNLLFATNSLSDPIDT